MQRTAALALVDKIEATWNTGRAWNTTRRDAWIEALEDYDEGAAGTAFVRLRNTHTSTPSLAEFLAGVRALTVVDAGTKELCNDCDESGWVQAADIVINAGTDREYHNSQVHPCPHCSYGRQAGRSTAWLTRDEFPLKSSYRFAPAGTA